MKKEVKWALMSLGGFIVFILVIMGLLFLLNFFLGS